ncbi:hypothetical protein [Falsirhodobacter sp. alg1]|uniref:hypothetical protein n=1 Tax=Falsirhodobacter sp. alg1 TaxID=1472418 RepID=UPI00128F18E6|nr:hypothetical protein [Falsirhodobacter sp. alg1]
MQTEMTMQETDTATSLPDRKGPPALILTLACIAVAWGGPLLLTLLSGTARTYLHDPAVWCKYVIGIIALLACGQIVLQTMRRILTYFLRAPLIAANEMPRFIAARNDAVSQRNSLLANGICLFLAYLAAWSIARYHLAHGSPNWAVVQTAEEMRITAAGRWANLVSLPLLNFLLFRSLWLHIVWSKLLFVLSRLPLRLVVDHPDGKAGLAVVSDYASAHWPFVLALSAGISAALILPLHGGQIGMHTYLVAVQGMAVISIVIFALPVLAFGTPLGQLKERTMLACSAQATHQRRQAERSVLGRNMAADMDAVTEEPTVDPAKLYDAASKMGMVLINRAAVVPVVVAMAVPFGFFAATQVPLKDVLKVLKGIILL